MARVIPVGALDDRTTRVLLAVVLHDRPTISTVAEHAGCSRTATHEALGKLRDAGLVTWAPRRAATLRATVTPVPPRVPGEIPVCAGRQAVAHPPVPMGAEGDGWKCPACGEHEDAP